MDVLEVDRGRHLILVGDLGYDETPDLRIALLDAVDDIAGQDSDLVVDVNGLRLTDPAMLGLFLEVHRRCHRVGRRLVLEDVPPATDRLLRLTRLSRVLYREDSSVCQ